MPDPQRRCSGAQDFCATDDCTSIPQPGCLSVRPAALAAQPPAGQPDAALDVLDSRRPTSATCCCNCPNTDTELPYVDLVIELLADAISPPVDSARHFLLQSALVNGTTYYYIVTAVNAVGRGPGVGSGLRHTRRRPRRCRRPSGVTATARRRPGHHRLGRGRRSDQLQHLLVHRSRHDHRTAPKVAVPDGPYLQSGWSTARRTTTSSPRSTPWAEPASAQVSATAEAARRCPLPPAASPHRRATARSPSPGTRSPGQPAQHLLVHHCRRDDRQRHQGPCRGRAVPARPALVNGTTYYYIVTAVDAVGRGPASAQVSATPQAAAAVPLPPAASPQQQATARSPSPGTRSPERPATTSTGPRHRRAPQPTAPRSPGPGTRGGSRRRLEATARRAGCCPQNTSTRAAFTAALPRASYPFSLPYSAGLDELRTYLGQLAAPALAAPAGAAAAARERPPRSGRGRRRTVPIRAARR